MKNNKRPRLCWNTAEYKKYNIEAPKELCQNIGITEGELMKEEDLEKWLTETVRAFSVIKQDDEEIFEELYTEFIQDIKYLEKIKKIDKEMVDKAINRENFNF